MTREDLFAAIGQVEESRLARTELKVQKPSAKPEESEMYRKHINAKRILRNLLIAALIVSMLAVTAYAAAAYLIFNSPEEMVTAIFGDRTGYDHKGVTTWTDPWKPGSVYENPAYDRVPVDETVMEEDIVPYVSAVGQAISQDGYTLTVDSYMYDNVTGCGFVTFLLENPKGISGYKIENDGMFWFEGVAPYKTNLYGKEYIIQDRTTDTCLAGTFYFQNEDKRDENLIFSFPSKEALTDNDDIDKTMTELEVQVREEYSPEEALQKTIELMGEAGFKEYAGGLTGPKDEHETWETYIAYKYLAFRRYEDEEREKEVSILIPLQHETLKNVKAGDGSIIITPISFRIDITNLEFLHTNKWGDAVMHADNVNSVTIVYKDGTEYVVHTDHVQNHVFSVIGSASDGKLDMSNRLTYMFNRIIDVEAVASVIVNGVELTVD